MVGDVAQRRAFQQAAQVRGGFDLARMRAQRVHFLGERAEAAGEGIDRHRRGEIGGVDQLLELRQREHAGREHLRGAVVERQAFLVRQRHRLQAGACERFSAPGNRSPW